MLRRPHVVRNAPGEPPPVTERASTISHGLRAELAPVTWVPRRSDKGLGFVVTAGLPSSPGKLRPC